MLVRSTPRAGKSKRLESWLRWSGRFLLVAGFILLGYVALVRVRAKLYDSEAERFVTLRSSENQARLRPLPEIRPSEATLREGEVLGHMEIPRLGMSAAVLEGTTSPTLRLGVGHIRGTAIPGASGNSVIAGHRDTFFRALKNIHDGDEIDLKTAATSTRYLVDWTKVVTPEDVAVMNPTNDSVLTLVTCYPFYFVGAAPKRFVVRAHQVRAAT